MCCNVLQCVAMNYSVLQIVYVCTYIYRRICNVLQCVAVCCSVLQCVADCVRVYLYLYTYLQCVAMCCSVLQCVAVCCRLYTCVPISMDVFAKLLHWTHTYTYTQTHKHKHIHIYSHDCKGASLAPFKVLIVIHFRELLLCKRYRSKNTHISYTYMHTNTCIQLLLGSVQKAATQVCIHVYVYIMYVYVYM